ncbi:hypothetical protein [Streptomyces sp. NPDC006551]|uniref:hypothetical protein n=1 Tax=Streptomyces sp. NPDC006551 TaxID=3157178 RepID=UPI0033A9CD79
MSRAANGRQPHPLTPADLPPGEDWWNGCRECGTAVQGGLAGFAAHRATVHHGRYDGDRRIPIQLDF